MPEILFVTWDGGGNVPPALGMATELDARGHRIRFLGHEANRRAVQAAGFEHEAYATARPFSSVAPGSPLAQLAMFADRGMGRDLLDSLRRAPADLVVVDCLLFGAMEALRQSGTRFVVLEHLYDAYLRGPWLHGPLGLGMRVRRLRPARSLAGAAATLVATLPELDAGSRRSHAAGLDFVGPVVPPLGPRPATPEPGVLISLSTYAFPGMTGRLQTLLDAAGELDARVVATTGPAVDPSDLRHAANTEVHRYVPHAEVMPAVSLDRGPHREAAARLGAAIRAMPGATNGADRIEELLRREPRGPGPGRPAARR